MLLAAPAWAQQPTPTPTPPDPTVQDIIADWAAESRARDHTAMSLQKLVNAYQKAEAERARLQQELDALKPKVSETPK